MSLAKNSIGVRVSVVFFVRLLSDQRTGQYMLQNRSGQFLFLSKPGLVSRMRELIDRHGMKLKILAASLKSPEEVVAAVGAGAHDITTTLDILKRLAQNGLSDEATREFEKVLPAR